MSDGLPLKYRPRQPEDVVGQSDAINVLTAHRRNKTLPHAYLFSGPSGCGKTTIARIVAGWLKCSPMDFKEINAADLTGVGNVREIINKISMTPMGGGKSRVYLFDEAHELSKSAQNALLKPVEEPPAHVYFMLATTQPTDILPTLRNRCCHVPVKALSPRDCGNLVKRVAKAEGIRLSEDVLDRIVEAADGSARQALVFLADVAGVEGEEARLNAVCPIKLKEAAFRLVELLMPFDRKKRPGWADVAAVLKGVEGEDAERLRHLVLACARGHMLKGGPLGAKAYLVVCAFEDSFFHSKHAGLARAVWECFHSVK